MSRSTWKGPVIDIKLMNKVRTVRDSGKSKFVICTRKRYLHIMPSFVGLTFGIYNGRIHVPVLVSENMIGRKFGEFSPTRKQCVHAVDKKTVRK